MEWGEKEEKRRRKGEKRLGQRWRKVVRKEGEREEKGEGRRGREQKGEKGKKGRKGRREKG